MIFNLQSESASLSPDKEDLSIGKRSEDRDLVALMRTKGGKPFVAKHKTSTLEGAFCLLK